MQAMESNAPTFLAERRRGVAAHVQAYAAMRDAIVRAELAPGRQLSENELAAWLGVSRTPIREALVRLRDERLVEIAPQLGTFVSRISPRAVAEAQFVREALECAALREGAGSATDEVVAALEENLRAQRRAQASPDHDAFYVLDDEFHHALCDLSHYGVVWAISQRAKSHLNRVRRLSLPMPSYLAEMINQHEAVVAAVAQRDPHAAEHALRHHLRKVLCEVPSIRSEHPDYFEEP
jgi:DNA-binding GntR family transcriptional regulator